MRKFIFTFVFAFIALCSFGQSPYGSINFEHKFDFLKYEVIDSLPIERVFIHFNNEIDDENFVSLGDGDYLAPVPHKDKMVIKMTSDKTKAIILYNSYCFGRRMEFDIEDNERRTILYHQDKNIYCGYIYDKEFKVCKYFESKKEFKRFIGRPMFNRAFPRR